MAIQFPATVELSDLKGVNGFVLRAGDGIRSVSKLGDINADEVDDLLLGAPRALGTGQTYVVYGGRSIGINGTIELSALNGIGGV